jgi:large subunit ribosomal protein L27e
MQKKIMKAGRVVILLAGRRAGKKAVIVKPYDEGSKKTGKQFPHALVAGVERAPMKVHKKMSKEKIEKRSRVKPFVKYVNYNHLVPTRFTVQGEFTAGDKELKHYVNEDKMATNESRKAVKAELKKLFQTRFNAPDESNEKQPNVDFFFQKLRF